MEYFSRAEIGLVPPTAPYTPLLNPAGLIEHWVGSGGMPAAPSFAQSQQLMKGLQQQALAGVHGDHYIDFEYNWAYDPCGRIFEGRGWDRCSGANGTTDSNAHYYAVVYLAGPGVPLTPSARTASLQICQEAARRHASIQTVGPHRGVPGVSTACPGDEVAAACPSWQANLRAPVAPPAPKVAPMYNPPLVVPPVVADLGSPTKGAWTLAADGSVRAWGGAIYKGGANGQAYFKGRTAARLEPFAQGYTIIATSGERYDFP